jgi:hypothetical protein
MELISACLGQAIHTRSGPSCRQVVRFSLFREGQKESEEGGKKNHFSLVAAHKHSQTSRLLTSLLTT